uniref:L-type lectin-like domain-containing protein n=1 Tax=Panagrolaimus superbus TaxID=310955 RepID=A0A914Y3U1_9BILA
MGSSAYLLVLTILTVIAEVFSDSVALTLDGTSVTEWRGYFKREHAVIKPYIGNGMTIPNWDIFGSTMVSSQQVRLTADVQSRRGALWNKIPIQSRDWELQVSFRVHGSTGDLFGDGFAIWYVQEPNVLGDVFGSKDFFRGLAVFLDTYSNHNGAHKHGHPYISGMISNGSVGYDHDRDGTHTQLGGEHTGCEAKFRNKDHETQILIRYVGDKLSIFKDVDNQGVWKNCMSVEGVRLPTGYYLGISAATGDLSDNHDILGVKLFEQEYARVEREGEGDRQQIEPQADFVATPRDHAEDPRPSKLGYIGLFVLVLVGIIVIVGLLFFGAAFIHHRNERSRKRFY